MEHRMTPISAFALSERNLLRKQEEAEQAREEARAALNPDFPYTAVSWDAGYWRLPAELTPIEK